MTLSAAASALGAPEAIVKRSAEARAKASGVAVDEILAAWAGGGTVTAVAPPAPAPEEVTAEEAEPTPSPPPAPAPTPVPAPSLPVVLEPEEEPVEAQPLSKRIAAAGRVGFWSGVILGVLGLLAASPWTLPNASVLGEEGDFSPALILPRGRLILVTALFSVLFGAIVASLSRTLGGWMQKGGGLSGRSRLSTLLGAVLGGVLGLGAGASLASFGQPVENTPELVQLPVVAAIFVVMIGGGVLGWIVAAVVQVLGIPAGEEKTEEVTRVRSRLTGAIAVPVAGIIALGLLVLPLAIVLIRSNHLASGGAAVLAVIAAASILAIASLSASRPGMRISRGEFFLALGGIGIVVMIVFAVMLARNPDALHEEEEATATEETVPDGEGAATTVATTTP